MVHQSINGNRIMNNQSGQSIANQWFVIKQSSAG